MKLDLVGVIVTRLFGLQHRAVIVMNGEAVAEGPWNWRESGAIADLAILDDIVRNTLNLYLNETPT